MIKAIVGDVLGSVYKGVRLKTKDSNLFHLQGRPTDDSVLTLAVAQAILDADGVPKVDNFAERLREFGGLYPGAGYGGNFLRWVRNKSMGPYNSWGNGSAMRASAIGWTASALPTHNHPEGIKGAQAVALLVLLARTGSKKKAIREEISERFEYNVDRTIDEIRPDYQFEVGCQRSVPEAIIAFLDATDFEDAVRNAVSLGGDADTQACIAGAIAGAFFGIPESILAWVIPRLDGPQLRILKVFAGRYMASTGVVDVMARLAGHT